MEKKNKLGKKVYVKGDKSKAVIKTFRPNKGIDDGIIVAPKKKKFKKPINI